MKNKDIYNISLSAAELFKQCAFSFQEQRFWTGYLMGLKHWKHKKSGLSMECIPSIQPDNMHNQDDMITHGYRIGTEGTHVHEAIQQLARIY